MWGYDAPNAEPDWKDLLFAAIEGTTETWFMDPGRYVEFRGVWQPPAGDSPGIAPEVGPAPDGEWGFFLWTGYEYMDPFDDKPWPNRIAPAGAMTADTFRRYGEGQFQSGDWSQPGFLFSYQYLNLHYPGQPPP